MIISILCAFAAGITIVVSRSINAALAQHIGAYESSFFNYLTGLLTSIVFLFIFGISNLTALSKLPFASDPLLYLGGAIGVINIVILNLVVSKVPALQLTLLIFIAQLLTGMLLDWLLYDQSSFKKMFGCGIVLLGLLHYQYVLRKQAIRA